MNSDSKSDVYWCNLPPDDFAQEAFKRIQPSTTADGGIGGVFQELYLAARSAFYGAMPRDWTSGPSSAFVGRAGEQGSQATLKVNNLRSHALAQHQIVTSPPLSWKAQAVNTDSRSIASASRGSKILEYLWKNQSCDERLLEAVLGAILYGEEFIFSPWSTLAGEPRVVVGGQVHYEGNIVDYNVPAWDLLRDGTAKSYELSPWKCVRLWQSKWDLIAEYPDKAEEILALKSTAPTSGQGALAGPLLQPWNSDRIAAYYFFHERTPALPAGLQAVLLSADLWLSHDALEPCYQEILPIHRMAAGELKGTPYAYTSLWEAMATQELADDIQSSLATNIIAFGKQLIWAEAGSNLNPDALAAGPQVLYGTQGKPPPQVMMLHAAPPTAFQHLDELRGAIRQIFGLNDIAMGQPDTAQMNAQAFALIASMAIQQNSDLQKRFVKCATNMGRSRLRIFRAKAATPRKVAIVGKHGPLNAIQETFTGEDLSSLDDVYVELDSPMAQTAAGRLQMAQLYMDRGFVSTPEQLENLVETGRLETLTQGLHAELIFIAEENEALLQGEPVPVKITDSHQLHIREHRAPTFSAQARSNPEVNRVTDQHIREHLDFLLNTDPRILAAMGQAAPMPPPGAPGAAPPGGPPEAGPPGPDAQAALAGPLDGQPSAEDVPLPSPPNNPLTGEAFVPPGGAA